MIAAESKLLTYEQAAIRLGCIAKTQIGRIKFIARRVENKELKAAIFGHRTRRVSEMEVLRYIADHETKLRVKR